MKICKRRLIMIILIFLLMIVNFITVVLDSLDYQKRVKAGNERWQQVEERIQKIEKEVGDLRNDRDN